MNEHKGMSRRAAIASLGGSLLCGVAAAKETGVTHAATKAPMLSGAMEEVRTRFHRHDKGLKEIEFAAAEFVSNIAELIEDAPDATQAVSVFAWLPERHALATYKEVPSSVPYEIGGGDPELRTMLFWGRVRVTVYKPAYRIVVTPVESSHWKPIPQGWCHV